MLFVYNHEERDVENNSTYAVCFLLTLSIARLVTTNSPISRGTSVTTDQMSVN